MRRISRYNLFIVLILYFLFVQSCKSKDDQGDMLYNDRFELIFKLKDESIGYGDNVPKLVLDLRKRGEELSPLLIDMLSRSDNFQYNAIRILETVNNGKDIDILVELYYSNQKHISNAAMNALLKYKNLYSLKIKNALEKKLCTNSVYMISRSLGGLCHWGDKSTANLIHKYLISGASAIRNNAAAALGQIGYVGSIKYLIEQLQKENSVVVKENIIIALGNIGNIEAMPALMKRIKDKNLFNKVKESLIKITKEDLGEDYEAWNEWYRIHRK